MQSLWQHERRCDADKDERVREKGDDERETGCNGQFFKASQENKVCDSFPTT